MHIDDYIGLWIFHFKDLGVDIKDDINLNYLGWKNTVAIWEAEPYHKIAQAMGITKLEIHDSDLYFATKNIPDGEPEFEWDIILLKRQVQHFTERYGKYYKIVS